MKICRISSRKFIPFKDSTRDFYRHTCFSQHFLSGFFLIFFKEFSDLEVLVFILGFHQGFYQETLVDYSRDFFHLFFRNIYIYIYREFHLGFFLEIRAGTFPNAAVSLGIPPRIYIEFFFQRYACESFRDPLQNPSVDSSLDSFRYSLQFSQHSCRYSSMDYSRRLFNDSYYDTSVFFFQNFFKDQF